MKFCASRFSSLSLNFHRKVLVFQHRRKLFCQQEIKWAYMDTLCQKNIFGPKIHTDKKKKISSQKSWFWRKNSNSLSQNKVSLKLYFWKNWTFGIVCMKKRRRKPAWVFEQEFLWLCILPAFTKIFLEDSFQGWNFFLCALNPKFLVEGSSVLDTAKYRVY